VLTAGVGLWATYGILRADLAVILANVVSMGFLLTLVGIKLRERPA
jgi:MtN3 and saliva related transmembrane protein